MVSSKVPNLHPNHTAPTSFSKELMDLASKPNSHVAMNSLLSLHLNLI